MQDEFTIPPPGLFRAEIIDLGPIIDPVFSDASDFREYLSPVETETVAFDEAEPLVNDDVSRRAKDAALQSEAVTQKLEGKRWEALAVGSTATGRDTEHALVIIYNYTDDVVVEATVGLDEYDITDIQQRRYQPLLTAKEERQAVDQVRDDARLPDLNIDLDTGAGLIVEQVNFRDRRYGHRLVDLRFGAPDRRVPAAFAIVDLSELSVVRVGRVLREEGAS